MSQRPDDRLKGGKKGDVGREERLAQQLRENLKRRKARERSLAAGATDPEPADAAGKSGTGP